MAERGDTMKYRAFGSTGFNLSEIGFGAWAIGGSWGEVSDGDATAALHAALDSGVNFIDTADVYGDGNSERIIARVLKDRSEDIFVATKAGRRSSPHVADAYNRENLTAYIERSLKNLDVEALDLVQLHCPPTDVYYRPEVFGILDDLKTAGKIRHYGVSVEKIEEAIKAIEYPGVAAIQIVFNIFRQRPAGLFFEQAAKRGVAVIARVPLASGLLTGRMSGETRFAADDHRNFNRNGEFFDVGETFSGVPYDVGLDAVEEVRSTLPEGVSMAQFALKWILMHAAVSSAIPGARNAEQARSNVAAAEVPDLEPEVMEKLCRIYDKKIHEYVHHRW
jgi:aryl-alcohol dehydrogenase-like predicted oxidoreductase